MTAEQALQALVALLREGEQSAWCDVVIGCSHPDPARAASFRDHFYDWRRRARAALQAAEQALGSQKRAGDGSGPQTNADLAAALNALELLVILAAATDAQAATESEAIIKAALSAQPSPAGIGGGAAPSLRAPGEAGG